jgi:hypothetical protein
VSKGYRKIITRIRTVDTYVVVIAVAHVTRLGVQELWIAFGVGKNLSTYLLTQWPAISQQTSVNHCLFFHAITGCDTVSYIFGIGKKKAWNYDLPSPLNSTVYSL